MLPLLTQTLEQMFPNDTIELTYHTPFQLLVAVMLSAQATDVQVNKITVSLFEKIQTPDDIIIMGLDQLTQAITSINYYRTKAKHIYETAGILCEKTGRNGKKWEETEKMILASFRLKAIHKHTNPLLCRTSVPVKGRRVGDEVSILSFLTSLPGVGIKTAKVVSSVLFGLNVIGVDTHIHRVANRLGLCNTKTPEQTSTALEKMLSDKDLRSLHHRLVLFGRYHCMAKNPKCTVCPLLQVCKSGKVYKTSLKL